MNFHIHSSINHTLNIKTSLKNHQSLCICIRASLVYVLPKEASKSIQERAKAFDKQKQKLMMTQTKAWMEYVNRNLPQNSIASEGRKF